MTFGRCNESQFLRGWLLLALLFVCRPSCAQKQGPPVSELKALTDFATANANAATNRANVGTWKVGFDAQGSWIGGHPCRGFKGLRCWSSGKVRMLHLPESGLSGILSPALQNLTMLSLLSLGGNKLSGDIVASLGQLADLKRLRVQGNQLTGSVQGLVQGMVKLEELTLSGNLLKGSIPAGVFTNLTLLQIVDISNNGITGTIPDDIANISSLQTLLLNANGLSGNVPTSLASSTSLSLNTVDLSQNSLTGSLPTVWNTPNLTSLDLSDNNLSGEIPQMMLTISSLTNLSLARNNFVGNVSVNFTKKFGCSAFDGNPGLAYDDPNCRSKVSSVTPPSPLLQVPTSDPTAAISPTPAGHRKKNKGLSTAAIVALTVGDIVLLLMAAAGFTLFWIWWRKKKDAERGLNRSGSPGHDSSQSSDSPVKEFSKNSITSPKRRSSVQPINGPKKSSFVATPALRPALKSVIGVIPDPANDSEFMSTADMSADQSFSIEDFGTNLVILDTTLLLEFEDLLNANAMILGSGSFGSVYMAVLEDGHMLAIKRLEEQALTEEHAFAKQCTHLAEVMHPNLLQMRGYCWSTHEKLLIFDYMSNGSVYSLLHASEGAPKPGKQMDWPTRVKVAVGTARALAHLHDSDMVHGNIKGTNVLLDEQFEPQVSDFGLEVLLHDPQKHTASAGYLAPELGIDTRHRSQEADVYSFGVLLLELLTGLEPMGKNNMDLPTWVQDMTSSNRTVEVFDPALVSMHVLPAQDVLKFLELAQACVSDDARARPSITIVLRRLESIMPGSPGPRPYVPSDESREVSSNAFADTNAFSPGFEVQSLQIPTSEPGDDTGLVSPMSSTGSFYSNVSSASSTPSHGRSPNLFRSGSFKSF